jgi:hypothetical protein
MRWALHNGQRVFVRGQPTLGLVAEVGRCEVAIYFPDSYWKETRIFLYDEGIVPVDELLNQIGGLDDLGALARRK